MCCWLSAQAPGLGPGLCHCRIPQLLTPQVSYSWREIHRGIRYFQTYVSESCFQSATMVYPCQSSDPCWRWREVSRVSLACVVLAFVCEQGERYLDLHFRLLFYTVRDYYGLAFMRSLWIVVGLLLYSILHFQCIRAMLEIWNESQFIVCLIVVSIRVSNSFSMVERLIHGSGNRHLTDLALGM